MKQKIGFLTVISAVALTLLISAFIGLAPANAQGDPPPEECQCKKCHDEQYYLYDSGKWYCLCKAPMTCVHCHGGDGQQTNANLAHKGMIANPFQNNAAICHNCHKEETQMHVDKFVEKAGVKSMPIAREDQPKFRTAEPQPFPDTAPRVFGFWEWFSVALLSAILVMLFIAWRR